MEEQRRSRRDLIQNIVIALLFLSAAALFTQTQLYNLNLAGSYDEAQARASQAVSAAAPAALTAPVRVAVTGDYGRYGSVALTTGDDGFADPLGRRLLEALGSAGDYAACTEAEFLRALDGPSLYYDFLESLPLSVLAGLLGGGEEDSPELSARRLLIVPRDSGAVLYLWDEEGDACFRAATAVSANSVGQVIDRYEVGTASFARDAEAGSPERKLAPCSLLPAESPSLPAYALGDPLASTDWLLSAMGFNTRSRTRHTESNGTELVVDGDRTLRIRPDNTVYYRSGQDAALRVAAAGDLPTAREAALGAGALLNHVLGAASGEARLYLQSLRRSGDTTVLRFGYQAGGVPIRFPDGGCAAEVTLTGTTVTALTLRLRQYNPLEEPSLLLPLPQALAVAAASPGRELSVGYVERGAECRAFWLSD